MEHLEKLLDLANNEFASVVKNGKFRSQEEIKAVGELVDMVKDVYCIMDMEAESYGEDDMSYADGMGGMSMRRGGSYRGESYYDGGSYARGRGRNARRDSMGRYSRNENYGGGSYMRGGYSRDEDAYIADLRKSLETAPTEEARQTIQRMIQMAEGQR